ncbi:asparagine synthase (glutamine-hydrolyzing) [Pseudalkalibacillus berkeleyi]|uniref:asparagine synthase (glutamine-hydrolyzing) n=1 Tax=Pseudalkalibacillus berkeleyi TaxID=1069813 RepID=A0ABS9GYW3_9BACL|nr:asparagine synthase (glutamine-hydrolyzing) [Pseudalkalibacillus berkeleyi]MCF6136788.1 asparagine synthase (glutamine-hydrolyzing) [Pseudalkalibacillus berkeleyi]
MCGITGWIDFHRDLSRETATIKKMASTLGKRGPDATNHWVAPRVAFGHARLIVVDPKGGGQPMHKTYKGSTYTMIYNGELYNTDDIRKVLLTKGHTFESHSDTEVLLTSYVEWGEACVEHLNGIFAFAIWDERKGQLFMARDRLGVKPLFFKLDKGRLLFGSELKSILSHPGVKAEVDREGLQEVFGLGPSRTPGHGVYRGIKELRAAHAMKFDQNGEKVWRYWDVESKEHKDSLDDTVENVRWLLKDAVERQLVADVPVCTFLSGGVDSSAISAFASRYFKQEDRGALHTYSIDYEDNDKYFKKSTFQPNSDGPWIKIMREYLKTVHHNSVIENEKLLHYLKAAVHMRDLPGMADVDSSLLWFCEEIKQQFTVGLSGECADEIFGGYPWFYRPELLEREAFPWMHSVNERQSILRPELGAKLQLKEYVQSRYQATVDETPKLDGESRDEARRREMSYLNMHWFMATLLDRKDRMSMGASLEVRVPFADHRIVEYAWNIPWDMKMLEGREKGILRKALEGILPDEILYRKKSPYPKTHHPEYTRLVKGWLSSIIADGSAPLLELVDRSKVEEIIQTDGEAFKTPWFGQLMTGPQLIAHLAQINTWLEDYNVNIVD